MKILRSHSSVTPLLIIGCFTLLLTGCIGSPSDSFEAKASKAKDEFVGDTSVSAEEGGPGFTGEGWKNGNPHPMGDPKAVPGGTMLTSVPNWPENLYIYGTGANTYLNSIIESLCYESLCTLDDSTLEFIPSLASHWKISDDKMTFTFRINPKARWSDGKPVTTEDVIATYNLIMDDTLKDPMSKATLKKFHPPVAKSKYILEVKCKEKDWRNFLNFCGKAVLPAHIIKDLSGADYLKKYQFKFTVSSGPYEISPGDIKTNESITITRRKNYWGDEQIINKGLNNFKKIRFVVIRDQRLSFDKTVKGELDFNVVYTAKWWVEDLKDLDDIKNGYFVKQKVYTKYPSGFQGLAFNMKHPPLDDLRVRKALAYLYDRKLMVDKYAYNEYDRLKSYFPNSDFESPENKMTEYDPKEAIKLLTEAGWKEKGSDGILVKDGKRLSMTISHNSPGLEKYFTNFKNDCLKAGVEINIELLTPETRWKNAQDKKFEITSSAWGGSLFPWPRTTYHSSMADKVGSNNIMGFKSKKADELIEAYEKEFDHSKRVKLLQQLDHELYINYPYSLAWYIPCQRIIYKNKFGKPKTVFNKYADWRSVFTTWWVDPQKEKSLKSAKKTKSKLDQIPEEIIKPWE